MRGFRQGAALSFISAAALVFVLGGCAATGSVSRDIHVKRGVTEEDDLIHFYGAPSQRIIRGGSEYFVYNARTMNITSADGSSCMGTPVFIFSYETKRLSDLKCRENIPAEELSNKAGDSVVVGVTDSGSAPLYDASSPETDAADADVPALAPSAGIAGAEALAPDGGAAPVYDAGSEAQDASDGAGRGASEIAGGDTGSGAESPSDDGGASDNGSDGAQGGGDEIPLAGDDGGMEIINR